MTNIEVLMMDGCTQSEAERHLKNGSIVFEESDLKEHFEKYAEEWGLDEEQEEEYRNMIESGKPLEDWGVVKHNGNVWFIMYCL